MQNNDTLLKAYRATPLWSWNADLDPDTCREQVREMARAGYGGAYMHARLGLLTPYLSQQFIECVRSSMDEAARCGLRMHLYDEDRWPSGWAGGAVPLADARFRLKALVRRKADEPPPATDRRLTVGVDGFAFDVHTMGLGHQKFNGTCYVDLMLPEAIEAFLQSTHERYADQFTGDLGSQFPSIFSDEPALTYLYAWPDGALPWTERLPELFEERTGTPLYDHLEALFVDRADSPFVRMHYYRICRELFDEAFMRPIHAWCQAHGICWTGHFMYEHNLALHFSWGVNSHASYRHFDWPGIDHLGRQVGEVVTAIGCRSAVHQFSKPRMMTELFGCGGQHLSFADRRWIALQQIVLGANHLVPHLMAYTLAGARKRDYPPTLSPQQPWWQVNEHFERPLAMLCELMARGKGAPGLLVIHPQESLFALSRGPAKLGRADSWMGRFFYRADQNELVPLDEQWKALSHRLLDLGYQFDYGDEQIIAECGHVDGAETGPGICVGDARYRTVIVPPLVTLRATTVELLRAFLVAGGVVLCWGDGSRMIDGIATADAGEKLKDLRGAATICVADLDALLKELKRVAPPCIGISANDKSPCSQVWAYTRVLDRGSLTLVTNLDRLQERTVCLRYGAGAATGPRWVWDGVSTQAVEMSLSSGGKLPISIEPGGMRLVVEGEVGPLPFTKGAPSTCAQRTIHAAELCWQVERLDENTLVLDQARFRITEREWSGPHPLLAIKEYLDRQQYGGALELEFSFEVAMPAPAAAGLQLITEFSRETVLTLNGAVVDWSEARVEAWRDRAWHPLDVRQQVKSGSNVLLVRLQSYMPANPHHTATPAERMGTQLESVMLLGDFGVEGIPALGPQEWDGQVEPHTGKPLVECLPPLKLHYLDGPMRIVPAQSLQTGDVVPQGLPYYAGALRYQAAIELAQDDDKAVWLQMERLTAPAAELQVNGQMVGIFGWPPLRLELTQFLRPGTNHLTLILHHSLRNLLGPHHHPDGEPVFVNPESFRPEGFTPWLETREAGEPVPRWRESTCVVEFGLFG